MTVFLWLTLNVCLLVIIGTWLGLSVQRSLALAAWPPLWIHLNAGNLELVILTLAMLGWRAAAVGRDLRAGVWLGLAAAIKLYPVLLLVPFVARRRWRLVVAAGTILVLSQLGDLAVVGPSGFVRYYTEILPTVSGFYSHVQVNNSPYGALLRLFGDASDVAPLIHDPGVVVPLTVAISLFALVALAKMEPEAAPVAILVALPTVWCTYAVLALPQMVKLLRWRIWRPAVLLACAAASVVYPLVDLLVQWSGSHALPMAALLAVQPFGFLGLLGLSVASACPVGRAARLACLSSLV